MELWAFQRQTTVPPRACPAGNIVSYFVPLLIRWDSHPIAQLIQRDPLCTSDVPGPVFVRFPDIDHDGTLAILEPVTQIRSMNGRD